MKNTLKALCAGALLGVASLTTQAANFILVNVDDAGVGFNDSTPATPVGGNYGTTVGQQRLLAFSRALQLWGSVLKSDVSITVLGSFSPLDCTATGGVLGQAGAWNGEINFPGAVAPLTIYPSALANALAGQDLYEGADIIDGADIGAFFNGSLGSTGCIEGSSWYYGLDNKATGTQIDFLNVFMHEMAHGLGFANWVNESTGNRTAGLNDIYMTFQKDTVSGKLWSQMSGAEIKAAAIRDGKEVWVGPNVTARAPLVLGPATLLATSFGEKDFLGGASFGSPATAAAFTGQVVAAVDGIEPAVPPALPSPGTTQDGCSPFANAAQIAGKIAIVRRGYCGFAVKAKNAQLAGATAVIIANNAVGGGPIGLGGTDPTVTIPAISVGTDEGNQLIAAGSFTASGFIVSATRKAGTDANGYMRLYSPTTVAPGSTASHFDVVAEPSVLMEPAITPLLTASHNVDLTVALLEDIGWKTEISFAGCGAGSGSKATTLTGEIYAAPLFFCADNAKTKGDFQSCSVQALADLMKGGIISGATKGSLGVCAANGK
jgi:hypothetical protein